MPRSPRERCPWVGSDPVYQTYHDQEWGVPSFDERHLFEMLILEGAQAGLSWITILRKRERYRTAFAQFDPLKMARFDEPKLTSLMSDPGIVRNRLKIEAAVSNARAYLQLRDQGLSLKDFVWAFVEGIPQVNRWRSMDQVPASTPRSTALSRALKRRGFRFVGPTICYAYMQAVGMVNDHLLSCFRHRALAGKR